jgi:protease-4
MPASEELQETEIDRDEGLFVFDKIAVIDIDGMLANGRRLGLLRRGDNPVSLFQEKLDKAAADKDVKAIVLRINSPGGTVAASDSMYNSLRQFKERTGKPVITSILDLGCSGAYYLACGTDGIVAQPSSITGSIGIIMQMFSIEGTMQKIGVKAVAIKSGKLKDIGSPLHDLSEEEKAVLQGIIDQFFNQFLAVIEDGRKQISRQEIKKLADGRIFTGAEAMDEKLIDRIGYPSDAIKWVKEVAGVEKAKVVIYHRASSYMPNIYGSAASSEAISGALVNVEVPDWLNGNSAQFLYLWQPLAD